MKISEKQVYELNKLQASENSRMGINSVKAIVVLLSAGQHERATGIYKGEKDKLDKYPEVQNKLREIFNNRQTMENKDAKQKNKETNNVSSLNI